LSTPAGGLDSEAPAGDAERDRQRRSVGAAAFADARCV